MIYLFSALYPEVQPLIRKFQLKKTILVHGVDCFSDGDGRVLLALTGSGVYNAIFSVSSVLAARPPEKQDLCLFYGSAAKITAAAENAALMNAPDPSGAHDGGEETGRLYRAAAVRDLISGRSWYPDLMWDTGMPDAVVFTGKEIFRHKADAAAGNPITAAGNLITVAGNPVTEEPGIADPGRTDKSCPCLPGKEDPGRAGSPAAPRERRPRLTTLYDLETAGFCEAAFRHFGPYQIMIFRFVSDEGEVVTRRQLEAAAEKSAGQMAHLILQLEETEGARQAASADADGENDRENDTENDRENDRDTSDAAAENKNRVSAVSEEEYLASRLHASVAMKAELHRYVRYADLAGIPWRAEAEKIMAEPCPDRRCGKIRLRELERAILGYERPGSERPGSERPDSERPDSGREDHVLSEDAVPGPASGTGMRLLPPFSYIYVEQDVISHPRTAKILDRFSYATVIPVHHYQDVFDRKRQDYALQHRSPALILAKNTGELIHRGSPVCQSFDERYFYYCSSVMNCPYDCEYCWLKGMYESGSRVIFVNIEDTFAAVEKLLSAHPVYLCVSYDSELLAADELTGYARLWSDFAAANPGLTIEIRTKGVAKLPEMTVSERVILAFTLNPGMICSRYERQAPSADVRIRLVREAMEKGFPVRLCFDPVIVSPGWKDAYRELMRKLDTAVDWSGIRDVSVGTFRLSSDYMKRMRSRYPDSVLLQFPFDCTGGFYHLPDETEHEAESFVTGLLEARCGKEKIFLWN